jgi:hypothetical protein
VKKRIQEIFGPAAALVAVVYLSATLSFATRLAADDHNHNHDHDHDQEHSEHFEFKKGTLVVSRSVYQGTATTVNVGDVLPPNCIAGTINVPVLPAFQSANTNADKTVTPVKVTCAKATANGTYPGVFANDGPDGSFGVTSPIFLDNFARKGQLLGTLAIDPKRIVTSFSSKSELALNRSLDKKSITFVGYVGGTGFVTDVNQLDVSNSNTPGVIDPTNPVTSQYYRSVAEVDAFGHLMVTNGNAYSGNNGRAAIKAHWTYYMAGNDNNGGLAVPKKGVPPIDQVDGTQVGVNLITSTGVELLIPTQTPPLPPGIAMIGRFSISQVNDPATCVPGPCTKYAADKPGKDTNFRGITIHDNTLYVTKGSGGNGINTVYQVGASGTLPTGPESTLQNVTIAPLPGFPTTLATGTDGGLPVPIAFPFGIWFANSSTLYVCDEGDGTTVAADAQGRVADAATIATAGVQKWHFDGTNWKMVYVLQNGLNIGVPYTITGYPSPATDGCRNIAGEVDDHGIATIYAVTSTISASGDQGADPNKLVMVMDKVNSLTLPVGDGDHDRDDRLGLFTTIRSAGFGEVLRGVALAPADDDDRSFDRDDHGDHDWR